MSSNKQPVNLLAMFRKTPDPGQQKYQTLDQQLSALRRRPVSVIPSAGRRKTIIN